MKNIAVLGATGSIGDSTLNIIRQHPDKFNIRTLTGHNNVEKLAKLANEFEPEFVVISDVNFYQSLKEKVKSNKTEILCGADALTEVFKDSLVDMVVAGIVGNAGMQSVLAAVESGKILLLANKESIVAAGKLVMDAAKENGAQIIPLDSEHNALYQCLQDDYQIGQVPKSIDKVVLTASGGPFWNASIESFSKITPDQAVAHPKWDMGAKISVDSATLMNKGFEVIEAHWLFNLPESKIDVMVHPQSTVHSMVYYHDGSVLSQMGNPDMRIPISYGLGLKNRITSGAEQLDLLALGKLEFFPPNNEKFPCLNLARQSIVHGGTASAVLNTVNEVTVEQFLQNKIQFTQIAELNDRILNETNIGPVESIEQLIQLDKDIRIKTMAYINKT